jgi:hypothetical protein
MSPNPGFLKLDLAIRGARLDPELRDNPELFRVPSVRDYVTRSLEVVLPEDISVSLPLNERFTESSPYYLGLDENGFCISNEEERRDVRIVPQPRYYARNTRSGLPMWRVGTAYGGYIAINPATGCGFTKLGVSCRFCDVPTRTIERDAPLSVSDVIETVGAAFAEGAVEFVYLHVGYLEGEDSGISFLEPYINAIKKHFDTLVAVQIQPPRTNGWIDNTYAMGVDALSYSVEIHDAEILRQHCAGRAEHVGRDRYYDALAYAATIFPSGTVWSDLIVGLEPVDSTMRGIDTLVGMNVLPVLSLFHPLDDTALRDHPLPSAADVAPVFAHLFHTVRDARINMNWVRDLSFAVTPLEARFFAEGADRTAPPRPFYRSRFGNLAVRNLSRMRRRLRVRKVSDSFDSSNL